MASDFYVLVFVAVALGAAGAGILLLAISRLRRRRAQLLNELQSPPALQHDRAYNRLSMAKRELEILARQGTEVTRARELISQAQFALDQRKFDRAYELAQSAHEALVAARRGSPLSPAAGSARAPVNSDSSGSLARPAAAGGAATGVARPAPSSNGPRIDPARPSLARHQVESQFELRVLDGEILEANRTRPTNPGTLAAIELRTSAQVAWDRADYTETLRLALKARRSLGSVETVAAPVGGSPAAPAAGSDDPAEAAERAASMARCPDCGYPVGPEDAFCRGCGVPRVANACPSCGTPRAPDDVFCGHCGKGFS